MNLNTRLFIFISIVCCCHLFAQKEDVTEDNIIKLPEAHIDVSFIVPFAVGDDFANKGLDFKYGLGANIKFYLQNNIFFGFGFQHLHADVFNNNLLGFYNSSNINTYFLEGGYRFHFNKRLRFEPYLAFGLTTYFNKRSSQSLSVLNFRDNAFSFIISPSFKYRLNKNFMIFLKPEYRIDNMNIRVAPEIKDLFDNANYLNFAIGISFTFQ